MELDEVTGAVIAEAVALHCALGPGLLENVYQRLMVQALARRGLRLRQNRTIPFMYNGIAFDSGLRVDLLVEDRVLVELKSVEVLAPVHCKQVLTYLRLLDLRVGLLINFGCDTLRAGLRRVVNNYRPEIAPGGSNARRGAEDGLITPRRGEGVGGAEKGVGL